MATIMPYLLLRLFIALLLLAATPYAGRHLAAGNGSSNTSQPVANTSQPVANTSQTDAKHPTWTVTGHAVYLEAKPEGKGPDVPLDTHPVCNNMTIQPALQDTANRPDCVTCQQLKADLSEKAEAIPIRWDVQCNICLEADSFSRTHQYKTANIRECANRCAQIATNCTAFSYLPLAAANNCFLNSLATGTAVSKVVPDNVTCGNVTHTVGDYVGVAVVSMVMGRRGFNKHCKHCQEFQADLNNSRYGDDKKEWSLHCHVDIPQHDMGVLPNADGAVDSITACAQLCSQHACQTGTSSQMCCQAFTYLHDNYYDQNCFLKTGLTVQSLSLNMTPQWNYLKPCVNYLSAWPATLDWCQLDPQCAQAKKAAEHSELLSKVSIGMSAAALAVSLLSGLRAILSFARKNGWWGFEDEPNKIVIHDAPSLKQEIRKLHDVVKHALGHQQAMHPATRPLQAEGDDTAPRARDQAY